MPKKISEFEFSLKVLESFKNEYDIYTEIPIYNRCVDAVLRKDNYIISIEFKMKNWKQALKQMRTHILAFDKSYLCMPKFKYPKKLLDGLNVLGAGLWLYDINTSMNNEILSTNGSHCFMPYLKEKILKYLDEIDRYETINN